MTGHKLGKLEKVELREVWKKEDSEFTPWLAQEENIALLGETVGINLEVEAQEKSVGPFRNEITDSHINFFGLEIELWRIGTSDRAPKFNIVCKPNDWVKTVSEAAGRINLTETKQLQLEYWTAFREYLLKNSKILRPQKPLPQHWTNIAIGRSYFHLVATVNTWDKQISVYLCLRGPNAKPHYYLLQKEKDSIEKELGTPLEWRELPENKAIRCC